MVIVIVNIIYVVRDICAKKWAIVLDYMSVTQIILSKLCFSMLVKKCDSYRETVSVSTTEQIAMECFIKTLFKSL